ncbi:MAG: c-type cytochrome [Gemmatimonadales bacterium]|nr:c-type cytochrome [Gemmatimonadota bacterium]MCL4215228.1 c-type cytochrome [Gemmatimonadales bacterium]
MRRSNLPHVAATLTLALVSAGCSAYSSSSSAASAPAPSVAAAPAPAYTPAMVALGDSLFNTGGCQRCHGAKGIGARNAPSLVDGPWLHSDGSFEEIAKIVTSGIAKEEFKDPARPFAMRPRGGPANLSDDQVKAVAAYVHSISRGKK